MLAPLPIEVVTTTETDTWHCECTNLNCLKKINLPPHVAQTLMEDKYLALIAEGCAWELGSVVIEGDGFKVWKFK